MQRRMASIAIGLVATVVWPIGVLAATPSAAHKAPRSIGVSVPPAPVSVSPGQTATIPIRVVNPGSTPIDVRVVGQGVNLLDNGLVQFTGAPDPVWSPHTVFPSQYLTVPAGGYITPTIAVTVPLGERPDLYYIGFVVTPRPTGSGVLVINQVGDFVTIDIPGPRVRKLGGLLTVAGVTIGPIQIGDALAGQVLVRNIGPSAVLFYGENDVTAAPFGNAPDQIRFPTSLLPIGRSRVVAVSGQPVFPIAVVTMSVTLTYPGLTEASTQQLVLTNSTLVISPWVLAVVIALLACLLLWRVYRAVRQQPAPAGRAGRQGTSATRR